MERRTIPGAVGYEADADGHIWSVASNWRNYGERILAEQRQLDGHLRAGLYIDGKWRSVGIHRLVWQAFNRTLAPGEQVRHLDGQAINNRPENLAVGNAKDNMEDRDRHGRTMRGSRHVFAKLSEQEVGEIDQLRAEGWTLRALACRFGVHHKTIGSIVHGISWKHCQRQAALRKARGE